ncbi:MULTISPECIES: DUF397 domain-containing protein [Streptomyces]|uniref:DUF397 domain-containing protein n=1 Tax=Streptomyces kasugaensis TaxID=1946 RepID=A0A4Q9HTW1_STRKA|nr:MULTISPECIES: DUF397 domain-containing protein [Streptomyces]MYU51877.1 DUF397 domain-containing protein [Streptomyces sp. SID7805]TBO58533.1 DUF397 domain-containing protein [Streptomyces kasugaensis]
MSSTPGPQPVRWIKSTYSGGDEGQCIEWAPDHARATGEFLVRDSKDPDGPHVALTGEGFAGLVELAKHHG